MEVTETDGLFIYKNNILGENLKKKILQPEEKVQDTVNDNNKGSRKRKEKQRTAYDG